MFPDIAVELLNAASILTETVGIFIIVYAVFHTVYRTVKIEFAKKKRFSEYEHSKRILIQKMIFALDFFVAADLIRLAVVVTFEEIATIAFIVAIRTVLSWSLSREVHLHKE